MEENRNYADECGDHGGTNRHGEPCGRAAGWGTEFDSGKCTNHRGTNEDGSSHEGNDNAKGNSGGGAPEENQNAQTHGLFSQHDGYYQDLSDEEQSWVYDFTHTLLDRHRNINGREPDMFDQQALKNIAIDFHRVAKANSWFSDEGMAHVETIHSETYSKTEKKVNVWASEIRQYNESIYRRMQKHGLLDDPESQKADAVEGIISILSEEANSER